VAPKLLGVGYQRLASIIETKHPHLLKEADASTPLTTIKEDLILNYANEYKPKSMLFNRDISLNLRNLTPSSE
jgi:hypothetical protein